MHNRSLNTTVAVYLNSAPTLNALSIENIEISSGIIQLNDQTLWQVDKNCVDLSNWKIEDIIMIGVNNKWHLADYPQILINTSLTNVPYVPAIAVP